MFFKKLAGIIASMFISDKDLPVTYSPFNCPLTGSTTIQGVRGVSKSSDVWISGTLANGSSNVVGLIYKGPLSHNGSLGKWYTFTYTSPDFSDVINTSCYGPNNYGKDGIEFVGSYKRTSTGSSALGCLYRGPLDGSGEWTTIAPNGGDTLNVYVHSTMGGLAVGNYDTKLTNGCAFIYDIEDESYYYPSIPGALTQTLYGIWHNGGTSYTVAGGYTSKSLDAMSQAFIADYDSKTKEITNLRAYQGENKIGTMVTHFEGINGAIGGYNLAAGFVSAKRPSGAALVTVNRSLFGGFGKAKWQALKYPDQTLTGCTSDTVYGRNIMGVLITESGISSYLAKQ
jgi:hypothetical protein